MIKKDLSLGAGGTEAQKISTAETERDLLISRAADRPAEYWLHVDDDGTERRYEYEPRGDRTLHVTVLDGVEQTKTWSIVQTLGCFTDITVATPRGQGWVLVADNDKFTTWQRPEGS